MNLCIMIKDNNNTNDFHGPRSVAPRDDKFRNKQDKIISVTLPIKYGISLTNKCMMSFSDSR